MSTSATRHVVPGPVSLLSKSRSWNRPPSGRTSQDGEWAARRIAWYRRQGAGTLQGIRYVQSVDTTDEVTEMHLMADLIGTVSTEAVLEKARKLFGDLADTDRSALHRRRRQEKSARHRWYGIARVPDGAGIGRARIGHAHTEAGTRIQKMPSASPPRHATTPCILREPVPPSTQASGPARSRCFGADLVRHPLVVEAREPQSPDPRLIPVIDNVNQDLQHRGDDRRSARASDRQKELCHPSAAA